MGMLLGRGSLLNNTMLPNGWGDGTVLTRL